MSEALLFDSDVTICDTEKSTSPSTNFEFYPPPFFFLQIRHLPPALNASILFPANFREIHDMNTVSNKSLGIDVQAELRLKGSPQFGPIRSRPPTGQASSIQRAVMNRQQQSRRHAAQVPPLQHVDPMSQAAREGVFSTSPALQPTPPSQNSSPSTSKSPGFAVQGGISSPSSDLQAQHLQQHQRPPPPPPPQRPRSFPPRQPFPRPREGSINAPPAQHTLLSPTNSEAPSAMHQSYYPPSFQKHYDQLGKLSRSFVLPCLCRALFVLD